MQNNYFSEAERYVKRLLKKKMSVTQALLVFFMITGFFGISIPIFSDNVYISGGRITTTNHSSLQEGVVALNPKANRKPTGSGYDGFSGGGDNSSQTSLVAEGSTAIGANSTAQGKMSTALGAETNVLIPFSVAIGVGSKAEYINRQEYSNGDLQYLDKTAGAEGQATAVGSNAVAVSQATAVGNDVYARGRSSIAIGSDDVGTYRHEITNHDAQNYFKKLYKAIDPLGNKYGFQEANGELHAKTENKNGQIKKVINIKWSPTLADGHGAIAIGTRSLAYDSGATAVGTMAFALKKESTALGTLARAEGVGSIALGNKTAVFADNSVSTGNESQVLSKGGMTYGYKAYAGGEGSIAIGSEVYSNTEMDLTYKYKVPNGTINKDVSLSNILKEDLNGVANAAPSDKPLKTGDYLGQANKTYLEEIELLVNADGFLQPRTHMFRDIPSILKKQGKNAIVIGSRSVANGDNSMAFGRGAYSTANNAMSIGSYSYSDSKNALAIGTSAKSLGQNGIAIGVGTGVGDGNDTSGTNFGYNSLALGTGSFVKGNNSSLVGSDARVWGKNSLSIGAKNDVAGINNVALGTGVFILSTPPKATHDGKTDATTDHVRRKLDEIKKYGEDNSDQVRNNVGVGNELVIAPGVRNSLILGTKSSIGDYNNNNNNITDSLVVGNGASVRRGDGYTDAMSIEGNNEGQKSNDAFGHSGNRAMAIGALSIATLDNSIALGHESKTDYTVRDLEKEGWTPTGVLSVPSTAKTGVLSVGSTGKERRIVNVAAGYRETDAVNVSQLKALEEKVNQTGLLDEEDATTGTGVHYLSVNKLGEEAKAIQKLQERAKDYQEYIQYKSRELEIEAREQRGDQLNSQYKAKVKKRVQELEAKSDNRAIQESQLKKTTIDKKGTSSNGKFDFDKEMKKVYAAKDNDRADKSKLFTDTEKQQIQASNFNNEGGKAVDSIAFGFKAKVENNATNGIAIGREASVTNESGLAIGNAASVTGAKGIAIGTGAAKNKDLESNNPALKSKAIREEMNVETSSGEYGVALGSGAMADARAISIGGNTNAGNDSISIGNKSKSKGMNSIALGTGAVTGSKYAIKGEIPMASALGLEGDDAWQFNKIDYEGVNKAIAIGDSSNAMGEESIALGSGAVAGDNQLEKTPEAIAGTGFKKYQKFGGGTSSIAIGKDANAKRNMSVAIGKQAKANAQGSVAIGESSEAELSNGQAYLTNQDHKSGKTFAVGKVSTNPNQQVLRRITGVADGKNDTDAVTVAQLKRVTGGAGEIKFEGDSGSESTFDLTKKIQIKGSTVVKNDGSHETWDTGDNQHTVENIKTYTSKNGDTQKILIGMKQKPRFNSIKLGTNGTVELSESAGNLSLNSKKITGLSNGTADNDAVAYGQVKIPFKVAADNHTGHNVELGETFTISGRKLDNQPEGWTIQNVGSKDGRYVTDNIETYVIREANSNNKTKVYIGLKETPTFKSLSIGDSASDTNKITISKDSYHNFTFGDKKLSGIGEGVISSDSKDAIRGSQIHPIKQTAETANTTATEARNLAGRKITIYGDAGTISNGVVAGQEVGLGDKITFAMNNGRVNGKESWTAIYRENGEKPVYDTKNLQVKVDNKDFNGENRKRILIGMKQNPEFTSIKLGSNKEVTLGVNAGNLDIGSKKIVNVANGSSDNDAVNYSQIKNLASKFDMNFKYKSSTDTNNANRNQEQTLNLTATNKTLDFQAGDNLTSTVSSGVIKYGLKDSLTGINSISGGTSNKSKLTLGDASLKLTHDGADLTLTKVGDNNNKKVKISGVADAQEDDDAVNFKQLREFVPSTTNGKINISADNNNYDLALGEKLELLTNKTGEAAKLGDKTFNIGSGNNQKTYSTKNLATTIEKDDATKTKKLFVGISENPDFNTVKVGNTNTVTLSSTATGLSIGSKKLENVAEGTISSSSNDAITGKQLDNFVKEVSGQNGNAQDDIIATKSASTGGGQKYTLTLNQSLKTKIDSIDGKANSTDLGNYALKTASNITGNEVAWRTKLNVDSKDEVNTKVKAAKEKVATVDGDIVVTEEAGVNGLGTTYKVDLKEDLKTKITNALDKTTADGYYANKQLSNIDDTGKQNIKKLITVSKDTPTNGDENILNLTTENDDTAANGNTKNYKLSVNKNKVKDLAKESIELTTDKTTGTTKDDSGIILTKSTDDTNHKDTYKIKLDAEKVKSIVDTDFAKKDASNVSEKATEWRTAIDVYSKVETDTEVNKAKEEVKVGNGLKLETKTPNGKGKEFTVSLSNDTTDKLNSIANKADTTALEDYAKLDGTNLNGNKFNKGNWTNALGSATITNPTTGNGSLVTEKAVVDYVKDKGIKFATDNQTNQLVKLGEQIDFVSKTGEHSNEAKTWDVGNTSDKTHSTANVSTFFENVEDKKKIYIGIKENPTFKNVIVDSLAFGSTTNDPKFSKTADNNLQLNSKKLTGLSAGTIGANSTDAINGSQLNAFAKEIEASGATDNDKLITVTSSDANNGGKKYSLALDETKVINKLSTGANIANPNASSPKLVTDNQVKSHLDSITGGEVSSTETKLVNGQKVHEAVEKAKESVAGQKNYIDIEEEAVNGKGTKYTVKLADGIKTKIDNIGTGEVSNNNANTVTGGKVFTAIAGSKTTVEAKTGEEIISVKPTATTNDITANNYKLSINKDKITELIDVVAATAETGKTQMLKVTPTTDNETKKKTFTIDLDDAAKNKLENALDRTEAGTTYATTSLSNITNAGKGVIRDLINVQAKTLADNTDENILSVESNNPQNGDAKTYDLSLSKSKVQGIAKDTVIVESPNNSGVVVSEDKTKSDDKKKTYKITLDAVKIKELAGTTDVNTTYAKVDGTNMSKLTDDNKKAWGKVGTDTIKATPDGMLATDTAVKSYVDGKTINLGADNRSDATLKFGEKLVVLGNEQKENKNQYKNWSLDKNDPSVNNDSVGSYTTANISTKIETDTNSGEKKVYIGMRENPTFKNVIVDSLAFGSGASDPKFSKTTDGHLQLNSKKLSGLVDGTENTDAATVAQVNAAKEVVEGTTGEIVKKETGGTNGTPKTYTLSLDSTLKSKIENAASKDASNLDTGNSTTNRDKWIDKLGTDTINKNLAANTKGKLVTEEAVNKLTWSFAGDDYNANGQNDNEKKLVNQKFDGLVKIQGGATGSTTDSNIKVEKQGADTLKVKLASNLDKIESIKLVDKNSKVPKDITISNKGEKLVITDSKNKQKHIATTDQIAFKYKSSTDSTESNRQAERNLNLANDTIDFQAGDNLTSTTTQGSVKYGLKSDLTSITSISGGKDTTNAGVEKSKITLGKDNLTLTHDGANLTVAKDGEGTVKVSGLKENTVSSNDYGTTDGIAATQKEVKEVMNSSLQKTEAENNYAKLDGSNLTHDGQNGKTAFGKDNWTKALAANEIRDSITGNENNGYLTTEKAVKDYVAKQGIKFTTDNQVNKNVLLGETVDIIGKDTNYTNKTWKLGANNVPEEQKDQYTTENITTFYEETATPGKKQIFIGIKESPKFKDTIVETLTIGSGDNSPKFSKNADNNLQLNNKKLTGLADGTIEANSKDAVTGGQLFSKLAEKADANANNITGDNLKAWKDKLGVNQVGTTEVVTVTTDDGLTISSVDNGNGKTYTLGTDKAKLTTKLNTGANISNPDNTSPTLVTDKNVKDYLDGQKKDIEAEKGSMIAVTNGSGKVLGNENVTLDLTADTKTKINDIGGGEVSNTDANKSKTVSGEKVFTAIEGAKTKVKHGDKESIVQVTPKEGTNGITANEYTLTINKDKITELIDVQAKTIANQGSGMLEVSSSVDDTTKKKTFTVDINSDTKDKINNIGGGSVVATGTEGADKTVTGSKVYDAIKSGRTTVTLDTTNGNTNDYLSVSEDGDNSNNINSRTYKVGLNKTNLERDFAKVSLDNISNDGKDVIKNLINVEKDDYKVAGGTSTEENVLDISDNSPTTGQAKTYKVGLKKSKVKDIIDEDFVKKDASNLDTADATTNRDKWINKLGTTDGIKSNEELTTNNSNGGNGRLVTEKAFNDFMESNKIKFGANLGNEVAIKLGEKLSIEAGDIVDNTNANNHINYKGQNIKTKLEKTNGNSKLLVGIKDNPTFKDITLEFTDAQNITHSGNISVDKDGLRLNSKKLQGLEAGVNDDDAVNFKQLKALQDTVSGGKINIVADNNNYDLALGEKLEFITNKTGSAAQDGPKVINIGAGQDKKTYSTKNIATTVENVKDGEAVNGVQKYKKQVFVGISENPEFDTVKVGNANTVTLSSTTTGLSIGSKKLENVAEGSINSSSTDAITGQQVHNFVKELEPTEAQANDQLITVEKEALTDGGQKYKLGINDANLINKLSTGANINTPVDGTPKLVTDKQVKTHTDALKLKYKANSTTDDNSQQEVLLSKGLDFTAGSNLTASVEGNGIVKYDLKSSLTGIDSISGGKGDAPDNTTDKSKIEFTKDGLNLTHNGASIKVEKDGDKAKAKITGLSEGNISDDNYGKNGNSGTVATQKEVKDLLDKLNADSKSKNDNQTIAYTDDQGNKVIKDADGKFYKLKDNGTADKTQEVQKDKVTLSAVNPNVDTTKGEKDTTKPITLGNIASGIGITENIKSNGADNTNYLTHTDGKLKELASKESGLDKAVNLRDLQAVVKSGITFTTNKNDEKVRVPLGTEISIKGESTDYANNQYNNGDPEKAFKSAKDNIYVGKDSTAGSNGLIVKLAKHLQELEGINLHKVNGGAGDDKITLATDGKGKLTLETMEAKNGGSKEKVTKNIATEDQLKLKYKDGSDTNSTKEINLLSDNLTLKTKTDEKHLSVEAKDSGVFEFGVKSTDTIDYAPHNGDTEETEEAKKKNDSLTTEKAVVDYVAKETAALELNVIDNADAGNKVNLKTGKLKFANGENTTAVVESSNGTTTVKYNLNEDVTFGKENTNGVNPADGKDGKVKVVGKDGSGVELTGKDGTIKLTKKDGDTKTEATFGIKKDGTKFLEDTGDNDKKVRLTYKNGSNDEVELATMKDGLTFAGDTGRVKRTLGTKLSIVGDDTVNSSTDASALKTKFDSNFNKKNIMTYADSNSQKIIIGLANKLQDIKEISSKGDNDKEKAKITLDKTKGIEFTKGENSATTNINNEGIKITRNNETDADITLKVGNGMTGDSEKGPEIAFKTKTDNGNTVGTGTISGLKDAEISATSTQAVTGKQLHDLKESTLTFEANFGADKTQISGNTIAKKLGEKIYITASGTQEGQTTRQNGSIVDNYTGDNLATYVKEVDTTEGQKVKKMFIGMKEDSKFKSLTIGGTAFGSEQKQGKGKIEANDTELKLTHDKASIKISKSGTENGDSTKAKITGLKDHNVEDTNYGGANNEGTAATQKEVKDVLNKTQKIQDGLTGTVIYTDKDGNKLMKEADEFYKVESNGKKGEKVDKDKVMLSLVNHDGDTKKSILLGNLKSALGLNGNTVNNTNIINKLASKTTETNNQYTEAELNSATTLRDLQFIARTGLDFAGNKGTTKKSLGSKVSIVGGGTLEEVMTPDANGGTTQTSDNGVADFKKKYNDKNVVTMVEEDGSIRIGIAKDLTKVNSITSEEEADTNSSEPKTRTKLSLAKDGATFQVEKVTNSGNSSTTEDLGAKTKIDKDGINITAKDGTKPDISIKASTNGTNGQDAKGPSIDFATEPDNGQDNNTEGKGTISGLKDLDDKSAGHMAANKNYVDTEVGKAKGLIGSGKDGKDGKDHMKNGAVDNEAMANKGLTGKDGLNGKDLTTKINSLRDGEAGTVVFTDKDGNRLAKANDGKYYKTSDVNADGSLKNNNGTPQAVDSPQLSLVNHEGETTKSIVLNNVGSALGLEDQHKVGENDSDDDKKEKIKKLKEKIVGKNGTDGLLNQREGLNKAVNLEDLQAVARLGMYLQGNNGEAIQQSLGGTFKIEGKKFEDNNGYQKDKYSSDNLATRNDEGTLRLEMLKAPKFDSVTTGDETDGKTEVNKDGLSITKKITPENGKPTDKTAKIGMDEKGNATLTDAQNKTASPIVTENTIGGTKISYKASDASGNAKNDMKDKTTTLTAGFNFKDTDNITAKVGNNGEVSFELNKDLKKISSIESDGKDNEKVKMTLTKDKGAEFKTGETGVTTTIGKEGIDITRNGATSQNGKTTPDISLKAGTDGVNGKNGTGPSIDFATKAGVNGENKGTGTINNLLDRKASDGITESNKTNDYGSGVNAGRAATEGAVKEVYDQLNSENGIKKQVEDLRKDVGVASDGKDGKNGSENDSMGSKGATGKDGLNGKSLTEKTNALRNGEAGTVVFTDKDGNRLTKASDGKYYKSDEVKDDGKVKTQAENGNKEVKAVDNPELRVVNANGETTKLTTLNNVASALGLDIDTMTKPIDKDTAIKAMLGDTATNKEGLLKESNKNELAKATNKADLQAVAQAGMNFKGNAGETHKTLAETLTIQGNDEVKDETTFDKDYSSVNLATKVDKEGKIILGLAKKLKDLEEIKTKLLDAETIVSGNDTDGKTTINKTGVVVQGSPDKDGKVQANKTTLTKDGLVAEGKTGEQGKTTVDKDGLKVQGSDDKKANTTVANNKITLQADAKVEEVTKKEMVDGKEVEKKETVVTEATKANISSDNEGNIKVSKDGDAPTKITNIAEGKVEAGSRDAITGGQLYQVVDQVNKTLNEHGNAIVELNSEVKGGMANAAAMSTLEFMDIGVNQATVAAAIGTYRGNQAVAVGVQMAPSENVRIHGKFSVAPGTKNHTMAGVGASWRFNLR